jgi:hypothetical protein
VGWYEAGHPRAEDRSDHAPERELTEQRRRLRPVGDVQPATDGREDEPEPEVRPHDGRGGQTGATQQQQLPPSPRV